MDRGSQQLLVGLQAGRGAAALMVVTYHSSQILMKYTGTLVGNGFFQAFGRAGVDFFFVLSGFIIYFIHVDDIGCPLRFARYIRKRFVRIYLPYWIVLVLVIPVYFVHPTFGLGYERSLASIVKSFTLYPADDAGGILIVPVAWTLAHEIVFYLAFGMAILNRRVGHIAMGLWFIAIVGGQFFSLPYPLNFFLYIKNIEFFLGIAVAQLVSRVHCRISWWLAVFGICLFLGTAMAEQTTYSFYSSPFTLGYGLGAVLIIFCLVEKEKQGSGLIPLLHPVAFLGDASYSIYLVHVLALSALIKIAVTFGIIGSPSGWVAFTGLAVMAVGVGVLFNRLIERRAIGTWRGFGNQKRQISSQAMEKAVSKGVEWRRPM